RRAGVPSARVTRPSSLWSYSTFSADTGLYVAVAGSLVARGADGAIVTAGVGTAERSCSRTNPATIAASGSAVHAQRFRWGRRVRRCPISYVSELDGATW